MEKACYVKATRKLSALVLISTFGRISRPRELVMGSNKLCILEAILQKGSESSESHICVLFARPQQEA